jgi:hypothetical protein
MTLMNMLAGKWASQAVAVAAEFRVADLLRDGSKTAAELAQATTTSADGMHRLLRALTGLGLCAESGQRRFRLTRLGQHLRTDVSQSVAGFARFVGHDSTWRPWGEFHHAVRTAEPAFDHVFGMPVFEYFRKTPAANAAFQGAMTSVSTMEAVWVVDAFDFARIPNLVDVAGDTDSFSQRCSRHTERCVASCSTLHMSWPTRRGCSRNMVSRAGAKWWQGASSNRFPRAPMPT